MLKVITYAEIKSILRKSLKGVTIDNISLYNKTIIRNKNA